MKKQINPTIKAHLIRGAFYLLLLLAVCAIPFALAQRNKPGLARTTATKAPPTKAQVAAASGKVLQSHAPGAMAGRVPAAKPVGKQNMLPFDVRSVPNLPLTSQIPLRTISSPNARVINAPPPP